jgi:hypothetical protein
MKQDLICKFFTMIDAENDLFEIYQYDDKKPITVVILD